MADPAAPRTSFRRSLGDFELFCLGLGGTIGSGIFVVPGVAVRLAGTTSLYCWLIVSVSACCVAYSLVAVQRRAPAGRTFSQLFVDSYGRTSAALLTAAYVIASVFGIATIAAGLGQYLHFFGVVAPLRTELAVLLSILGINLFGIALSGATENALSLVKVIGLLAIILVLAMHARPFELWPAPRPPVSAWLQTIVIVYWSFTGFEISAIPVEEMRDPQRIGPVLFWVMAVVLVVYVSLNAALLGAIGVRELAGTDAPVAAAVGAFLPHAAGWVAVLAIVTMLSALNAYVVAASRALHDLSRLVVLRKLSTLSSRGVPAISLVATCGGAAALLALSNQFDTLATIAVILTLAPYAALCWSARRASAARGPRTIAWLGAVSSGALILLYLLK